MNIALDYDDTYTRDPRLWDAFISVAKARGHTVVFVTMRHPHEPIEVSDDHTVHYTGRKAKKQFMDDRLDQIDVWIDDSPHWILMDAAS